MFKIVFFLFTLFCISYSKPIISVSIAPYEFFVKKIAKDTLDINVLIKENFDEHNLDLKPKTMTLLEKSDIYFESGLEFESILKDKFKDYGVILINTQENINLLDYQHGNHIEKDPHTWLDPILVKQISKNISKALIQKYPQNKAFYEENLNIFLKELDLLNKKIQNLFKDINKNEFIIYHPSWNYFSKRYNLIQIPIELNGKEPSPKYMQKIIQIIKEKNINTIFIEENSSRNFINYLAKKYKLKIKKINYLSKNWDEELLKSAYLIQESLK